MQFYFSKRSVFSPKVCASICSVMVSLALISCSQSKEQAKMEQMAECKQYYESVIKELSTDSVYFGRSNYNNGDIAAAHFIIDQIKEFGGVPARESYMARDSSFKESPVFPPYKSALYPLEGEGRWAGTENAEAAAPFLQGFTFNLNVMRGAMSLKVDGKNYVPTIDYVAKEFSPSCNGKYRVAYLNEKYYNPDLFVKHLNSGEYKDAFVVVDWELYNTLPFESIMERYAQYLGPLTNVGGIILKDATSAEQFPYFKARAVFTTPEPVLFVNSTFPNDAKELEIELDAEVIEKHDAHNIVAFMKGSDADAQECITFVAHYDHLGAMGSENVFPGANDNSSGVAMLLSLMKYWQKNEHRMPLQFIFQDAEETNLLGAFYYAANPVVPLEKIKCLIECDMIADSGDTLQCRCEQNGEWILDQMKKINSESADAFTYFNVNGIDDYSDHYAYHMAGVDCLFFTTEGKYYQYYHTPRDTYDHTTSCNYNRIFNMITTFVNNCNTPRKE